MKYYKPMLARETQSPFSSPEWIFEVKWDGVRALIYKTQTLSIQSRNNKELLNRFPEFREIENQKGSMVLDAEIIVMEKGAVSFKAAIERLQASNQRDIEYKSKTLPATLILFDILELNGESLLRKPLMERKKLLTQNLQEGKHFLISDYIETNGEDYYKAVTQKGLEGIIAKKKNSKYVQGRSNNWLKIKHMKSVECIIAGYTQGNGNRESTFGALLLGLYDKKDLIYVGRVGTGFSQSTLEKLIEQFQEYIIKDAHFKESDIPQNPIWLKPVLVCSVDFQEVTPDRRLRMPRFKGQRGDKKPEECKIDQIMKQGLTEYTRKRDFKITPEPEGKIDKTTGRTFVVQEHHARRLHWDLRLERDGVLKSWAIPKGIPKKPGVRHLAVLVEDHPIEYGVFEGKIPDGQYGAGDVTIWDQGVYEALKWESDKVEFLVQGGRMKGMYVLVRIKKSEKNDWLLLKARTPA